MRLAPLIFPSHRRFFPGQRWLSIALRSLHLVGVAGMGAGLLAAGPEGTPQQTYLVLTLATGVAMSALDLWSDGRWLLQLCGQSVLLKLLLIAAMPVWPPAAPALFLITILISALISHAPARVRHFQPIPWRSTNRACEQDRVGPPSRSRPDVPPGREPTAAKPPLPEDGSLTDPEDLGRGSGRRGP